jgi:hypothetical protein
MYFVLFSVDCEVGNISTSLKKLQNDQKLITEIEQKHIHEKTWPRKSRDTVPLNMLAIYEH